MRFRWYIKTLYSFIRSGSLNNYIRKNDGLKTYLFYSRLSWCSGCQNEVRRKPREPRQKWKLRAWGCEMILTQNYKETPCKGLWYFVVWYSWQTVYLFDDQASKWCSLSLNQNNLKAEYVRKTFYIHIKTFAAVVHVLGWFWSLVISHFTFCTGRPKIVQRCETSTQVDFWTDHKSL